MELGYGFTNSVEDCRSALAGLGAREISTMCAARVLAHMARTCTGLDDAGGLQSFWANSSGTADATKDKSMDGGAPTTWNVEVFVQTIKDMVRFYFSLNSMGNWYKLLVGKYRNLEIFGETICFQIRVNVRVILNDSNFY